MVFSYISLDLAFLNDSTEPPIHPLQLGFLRDKMCAPGKRQQCIPFFIISSKKGSKDSREEARDELKNEAHVHRRPHQSNEIFPLRTCCVHINKTFGGDPSLKRRETGYFY